MFKLIELAVDYTEASRQAVTLTAEIAKKFDSEVLVEHVLEVAAGVAGLGMSGPVPPTEETAAEGAELTDAVVKRLTDAGVRARAEVRGGFTDVGQQLLAAAAENHADLIVMGTRGLSDLGGLIVGSESHRVLRKTTCPVLLVR